MKQLVVGMVAHVDAGKTTLNESVLFNAGAIRKMGRVDFQNSYMDYDDQEKAHGITIFDKTASITYKNTMIDLVDTPGHIDFSSEMERSLKVLDLAILVVSGSEGIQPHTETIWKLLDHYNVPTIIFANKMDISLKSKEELIQQMNDSLSINCIDFTDPSFVEKAAFINEEVLEEYTFNNTLRDDSISKLIYKRELFPVLFGSALKNNGVVELLDTIDRFSMQKQYPEQLALQCFKVEFTDEGKLTYVKVTGGSLKAKDKINEEKIDQIRKYSGEKYTLLQTVDAGQIVTLKGIDFLQAGDSYPDQINSAVLGAFMSYKVVLPNGCDTNMMSRQLNMLSQEDPQIEVSYNEINHNILITVMGEIQKEVIVNKIKQRTGVEIQLTDGDVVYRESITNTVNGYGHYEPLRHYAEVHLRLEPLARGAGLVFDSEVSTDDLALNWQRLILTHLKEKHHRGVLIGAPVTDMKITLINGKAHLKHTEGGDFRQATYRAVRQGLKMADSIILEPYFEFEINLKSNYLSRVLYDLDNMECTYSIENIDTENLVVKGSGPVRKMQNYQTALLSATSGTGRISMQLQGYQQCKDPQPIIDKYGYDSESDTHNPTGSVFCSHGAGFYVPYDYVEQYIHLKSDDDYSTVSSSISSNRVSLSEAQLQGIFDSAGGRNKKDKTHTHDIKKEEDRNKKVTFTPAKPRLIIVDGYNLMHTLTKTKDITSTNFDGARDMLINSVSSYAGYKGCDCVIVFDAYLLNENIGKVIQKGPVSVVYTKSNQTADSYIEKLVHDYAKDYTITVISSDMAVQTMVLNAGATRMSSREYELDLKYLENSYKEYLKK